MIQPQNFSSLATFIQHLQGKTQILAILQYGNRDYQDMSPGGDFDLNLILDPALDNPIAGLHFHIQDIPVDCGFIDLQDLDQSQAPSDYHTVLASSKLLFDRTGKIAPKLEIIKNSWQMEPAPMPVGEIAFERFIRKHILDKFSHRLLENEVYSRVFLSGNIFYLLEAFMKIEQLNPYDFKGALAHMQSNFPEMYKLFEAYEMSHDLQEKFRISQELTERVLQKIGGPWKKGEVIFHYVDQEKEYSAAEKAFILDLIF